MRCCLLICRSNRDVEPVMGFKGTLFPPHFESGRGKIYGFAPLHVCGGKKFRKIWNASMGMLWSQAIILRVSSGKLSPTDDYCLVAAIDFGTTHSGYVFSSRDNIEKDSLKIDENQAWNAESYRHISQKTPTCLFLDDRNELVSFGYEAENKYSDIVFDRKQIAYFFFQRFKTELYKNKWKQSDCSSRGVKFDKKKTYYGSRASNLMIWIFNYVLIHQFKRT